MHRREAKIRVLCVDDEEDFLSLTRTFLEAKDLEVCTALTGMEALTLLDGRDFDVVVSDYEMFDMDGLQLLAQIRDRDRDLPFVIFTGRGREEVVIKALNQGASAYIQKAGEAEIQFLELSTTVIQLGGRRQAQREVADKNRRISQILESMSDGFISLDRDLRLTYANRVFARLARKPLGEIIDEEFLRVFPFAIGGGMEDRVRQVMRTGEMLTYDIRHIVFGEPHWFRVRMYPQEGGVSVYYVDYTDQRKIEQQLIEHQERLELVMESADLGYWDWTVGDGCMYVSEGWLLKIGHDPGAPHLTVREWNSRIHPDDLDNVQAQIDDHLQGRSDAFESEHRMAVKDGSWVWVLTMGKTMEQGIDGKPTRLMGVIMDVDKRKTTEIALEESEEKYRELVERAGVMMVSVDLDLNITFLNDIASTLFGYKEVDLLGRSVLGTIFLADPSTIVDMQAMVDEVAANPDGYVVREFENRVREGGSLQVSWSSRAMLDDGKVVGVLSMGTDITDRRRIELNLKESLAKYSSLINDVIDFSSVGILIINQDLRVVHANQKMEEYFGLKWSRMIGRDVKELYRENLMDMLDDPSSSMSRFMSSDRPLSEVEECTLHILPSGERRERHLSYRGQPIRTGHFAGGWFETYVEVTDLKRIEETLQLANRKLNLLGAITRHDVLSQLSSLSTNLEQLEEWLPEEGAVGLMVRAQDAARRIRRDIEFTRLYEELGEYGSEWICVGATARGFAAIHMGRLFIDMDLDVLEVDTDPLVERVFQNLIENALVHGGSDTKMHVYMTKGRDQVTIIFEDNGRGIPDDEKELIFRYGYGKGGGLGLFLSREILSTSGMEITETGEEGRGARFEITVPSGRYRFNEHK